MDSGLEQIARPSPPPRAALRTNPIQWKNLYHHRYGPCTYAPPLPRNPSTTTFEYPNTDAFLALQDAAAEKPAKTIAHAFQGFSWGDSGLPATGGQRTRSNSNTSATASPFDEEPFTGSQRASLVHRTSFLLQRKAQLILRKKKEMEELRKQNPQELEACVLSVNQSAWTLIADDKIAQTSGIQAKEYAESARQMKERLMAQFATYPRATPASSAFGSGGVFGAGGSATPLPVYERPFAPDNDASLPLHATPSGSTNPMHQLLGIDAEHRAVLLAEMSPFFAVISPPTVVNLLHTATAFRPGICAAPVIGGAGDSVGLPIFCQFATWEEACTRRGQWSCTPFHFMLTRDGSFNHAHAAAILLLLETLSSRMHRHNRLPEVHAHAGLSPAEKPLQMLSGGPYKRGGLLSAPTTAGSGTRHGHPLTPQDEGLTGHTTPTPRAAEPWDGKKRFGCGKCVGLQNPNPCPLFALETVVEDLLVVYEHAGSRMALPMMRSVLRVFLDKALKPALSEQLFGKEALLDVYSSSATSKDGLPGGSLGEGRGDVIGGGTASDDDSDMDDDSDQLSDPVTGGASIFSEREFHSVFILSRYFLDGPLAMSGTSPSGASGGGAAARRPGGGRARDGGQAGATAAANAGGYVRIQAMARAPTVSLCDALVRYEEARRWQRRLSKLRVRQVLEGYQSQPSASDPNASSAAPPVPGDPSSLPTAASSAGSSRLGGRETLRFEGMTAVAAMKAEGEMRTARTTSPPASRSPSTVALLSRDVPPATVVDSTGTLPLPQSQSPPPSHATPGSALPPPPPTKEEVELLEAIRLEEAFPKSATRLGTALIALTSYLRLHGMGWSQAIFRSLLDHLKDPLVQLYVTDDHLPPPPTRQVMSSSSLQSRPRGSFGQGTDSQQAPRGGGRQSVSSSGANRDVPGVPPRGGSFLRRLSDVGPRDDPLARTGSFASGSRTNSVVLEATLSPRGGMDSQWTFPVEMTNSQTFETIASAKVAIDLFPTEGFEPAMIEFLTRMHAKERDISAHIHRSLDMFLTALVNSHSEQKIPSGISYLVTTLCAIVHSHLLSGVVMASALHAEGIEPDSVDMVQHLVQALLGSVEPPPSQQPPQQQPPKPAPSPPQMPQPTATVDQSEPSSPTSSTATTSRRRQTVFIDTPAAPPKAEPPKAAAPSARQPPLPQDPKHAAGAGGADPALNSNATAGSTSISLVNDIRTFRLAKFILFDCWLLPLLSNAQRFGLVPPHASPHLLNNISAFVRYCKILVNSTYVQREEERKQSDTKSGRKGKPSDALDGLSLLPSKEMESAAWQALKSTTLPPYISGIYHANHGTLVQLFRLPKQGGAAADDDATSSRPDSNTSSNPLRRGSRRKSASGSGGAGGLRRSSRSGSSSGGFYSVVKRRTSVSKLASPRGGPTAARLATAEYFIPQDRGWPALGQLSSPLQQLNVHLGIVAPAALGSFVSNAAQYFDLGSDESNALQQVETFCWTTSTDDDHSRVVPEFQVSHDVAVRCCESLYHVVTGQHPATMCLQEVTSTAASGATEFDAHRSSVVSTASADTRPTPAAKSSAERPGSGGGSGSRAALLPPSQECVNVFLRCLHSVLLHPTIAGAALDHLSVNHRKLFQHLLRPTKLLNSGDDSTTLAQTLYPFLIVGVKDQPLVDVNALTVLLASGNSSTDAATAPSAYIQAKRRLLSRQLFLSTGARGVAASVDEDTEGSAQPKDAAGSVNKTRKRSVAKERSAHPADHLQSTFPAWWAYVAASLCAKAESVIHECSSTLARKWDKRCRAAVRRHSQRDIHTESGPGTDGAKRLHKVSIDESAGGAVPSALQHLSVEGPRTRLQLKRAAERVAQATVLSPKAPRKPAGDGGDSSGTSREGMVTTSRQHPPSTARRGGGGEAKGASTDGPHSNQLTVTTGTRRSSSTTGSDLFKKRCSNPLMHRWRAAVTNLVSKSDDEDEGSSENERSFQR